MDGEATARLQPLFGSLDQEVSGASPRCEASGRCCRFKEYGHTLFLSDLEAEALFEVPPPAEATISEETCPYQVQGLCTARERRPLGCRVYFCDPGYQDLQSVLSERYVGRLKQLYDLLDRPWSYRPLHFFLRERFGRRPTASTMQATSGRLE